ncbi:hypothetical protein [Pseudarthrobacter sp. PS3-L1]|uniref:restriction endonuclease subunit S n=1 Tax=Pseudarthrobacter sp. PS3-L1 TaxID=3046207 RepID=UPI0024BB2B47|nr:hypothetical protein [Pseudarthrobacter sp. PS3-L1]MDJ0322001.1 hypothetical protein [Pseudarthrobacter sp. PS3-L1]
MCDAWREILLSEVFEPSAQRLGRYTSEPTVFSISKYDGFVPADEYHGRRIASAELDKYKVVDETDWAYSTIHIDEGSIARNGSGRAGVVSPMYTVMRWIGEGHNPLYFELLLRSTEMLHRYADNAQGSIDRRRSLPWKTFAALSVVVPSFDEQRRIVDLAASLDDTIEAADHAAAVQRSAYSAKIQSLPGDAAPLSELLLAIDAGKSPKGEERVPEGNERAVLKVSAVGTWGFDVAKVKTVSKATVLDERTRVQAGDVLMVRANGVLSRVGAVCQVTEAPANYYLCDKTLRLVPNRDKLDAEWLVGYLRSSEARSQIEALTTGSDMRNITQSAIKSIRIPNPGLTVQQNVGSFFGTLLVQAEAASAYADSLRHLRSELLTALLAGGHEIPSTYDEIMSAAV